MKSLTGCGRFASILLAVLFFASPSRAQQIPQCASEPAVPSKTGCLLLQYDRFKDSTIAALQFMVVDKGTERRVVFMLISTYAGESPAGKDRAYALAIISVGTKVEPSRLGRVVDVLIDGNVRSTMTLVTTKATVSPVGVADEQILSMMSADDITKLVKARTLEMRMGADEFSFDDSMRQNLYRFWDGYVVLVHS
jgi:hypothetical protein